MARALGRGGHTSKRNEALLTDVVRACKKNRDSVAKFWAHCCIQGDVGSLLPTEVDAGTLHVSVDACAMYQMFEADNRLPQLVPGGRACSMTLGIFSMNCDYLEKPKGVTYKAAIKAFCSPMFRSIATGGGSNLGLIWPVVDTAGTAIGARRDPRGLARRHGSMRIDAAGFLLLFHVMAAQRTDVARQLKTRWTDTCLNDAGTVKYADVRAAGSRVATTPPIPSEVGCLARLSMVECVSKQAFWMFGDEEQSGIASELEHTSFIVESRDNHNLSIRATYCVNARGAAGVDEALQGQFGELLGVVLPRIPPVQSN